MNKVEKKFLRLFIISGLSGSGKTHVMNYLEDVGYFCIDNFPPYLLNSLVDTFLRKSDSFNKNKLAIAIDIRGGKFLNEFNKAIKELKNKKINYEILFMEASSRAIIARYKLTRRMHPLIKETNGDLVAAIKKEREILVDVKSNAARIIDTTSISILQCRKIIDFIVREEETPEFLITLYSFGFKYGLPIDADLVMDVRFLPNPFYIENLKKLTGINKKVQEYIFSFEETNFFLNSYISLLKFLIPKYIIEGKRQLVIAIGCTGGQHRSVVITEALNKKLNNEETKTLVYHREIWRYKKEVFENLY